MWGGGGATPGKMVSDIIDNVPPPSPKTIVHTYTFVTNNVTDPDQNEDDYYLMLSKKLL